MADRTVKVNLVAQVNGYISGMDQASKKTRELGSEAEKLAQRKQGIDTLGRSLFAVGVLAVAGVALAIKKFAEFDQAISNVAAVTQESAENMDRLRAAALDAGGRTIFTATQAANAIEELGKAGLSTADILGGGLDASLALAASGQLEVARAAEITATTLKQYKLEGSDAARVTDVLSAAAGKSLGSVEDLAQGLKFVGPIAAGMGVSIEETAGALSLFADQGLLGEQAGTSLRGVLASLTSPSKSAKDKIDELGISLYDAQGSFLGLENLAGQLSNAFSGMDDASRDAALGVIFGNAQVTAARVLFDGGATAIRKYTDQVNDSGYAARVAADRLDNLSGDVEKLGGAFDTALIQTGSGANEILRSLTQGLTFLVDGVGALPAPVLTAAIGIGVFTAAVGLAGGTALLAVPKIVAMKDAMVALQISAKGAATAVGLAGAAFAAATLIVGFFINKQAQISASADEVKGSLEATTGALTDYSRELVAKKLAESGAFAAAKEAGISQRELTDAVLEGGDALDKIRNKFTATNDDLGDVFSGAAFRSGNARDAVTDLGAAVQQAQQNFKDEAAAASDSSDKNDENADTLANIAGQAAGASESISDLADMIRGFADATLSSRDAERQFQAAIDDATAAFAANGATLDINTEAGRANQSALDDIAEAAKEAAAAKYEETGSQEAATGAIAAGRQALIDQLAQYNITGAEAEAYADQLGLIPGNIATIIDLNTDPAQKKLDDFILRNSQRKVTIAGVTGSGGLTVATGGYISGPGSGTSDSIPARLSNGEFVVNARSTAMNRDALEAMNAGRSVRGYAGGGFVASPRPTSGPAGATITIENYGTDPLVVAEMTAQRLSAKLV